MMEPAKKRVGLALTDDKPAPAPGPELSPDAPLRDRVEAALRSVYDPEIPVNIHDLGLIYDLQIDPFGAVHIRMTLTSPACPVAGALPAEVQAKVAKVVGVTSAIVDLVWEPPWDKSRMSEEAQLQLGFF
jgi:FeS assembly SUF system protein